MAKRNKNKLKRQKLNKLKRQRISGTKAQRAKASKYFKRETIRVKKLESIRRQRKIAPLSAAQKQESFKSLLSRVQSKVDNLRYFEEQYKSMSSKIKTLPLIPIKFSTDEMTIDLKATVKQYTETHGRKYQYTTKVLKDILKTAEKFSEDISNLTMGPSFRTELLGEALYNTFMSERFKGMSDSANRNTYQSDGDNLAMDTVAESIRNVKGIDNKGLVDYLNNRYERQGLGRPFDLSLIEAMT